VADAVVLPVYNEADTIGGVLDSVRDFFSGQVVVVDDGSTDETPEVLAGRSDVQVIALGSNRGYGAALRAGIEWARATGIERLVTMDCDGQHEPAHVPEFLGALQAGGDVISGSRYLPSSRVVGRPPLTRREVNERVTAEVNRVTGWGITDAFCGFKAYRVAALAGIDLEEPGYAMPLEFWAKAFRAGLSIRETPVERIYCDYDRSFGADLDDPDKRLEYYLSVWRRSLKEVQ
jgi:dolichol-phosphate mannosyltransferase